MSQACIILAGGQGSRLGGRNKALLAFGADTFLSRIARTCRQVGVQEVLVVVAAPHMEETVSAAATLDLAWICNDSPELGMASSVAVGFARAIESFSAAHCWLWPVDAPGATAKTLELVHSRAQDAAIITPCYQGRGGHPALVAREVWPELAGCSGAPEGARSVFRRDVTRLLRLEVDDASVCQDVDVMADLQRLA